MKKAHEVLEAFKQDKKFFELFKIRIQKLKTNISHNEILDLSIELENCNVELFDLIFTLNSEEYLQLQNLATN